MIFYKEYRKGSVPEETELQDDLRKMMEIYKEYADGPTEEWWPKKEEYDPGLSKQDWIKILSDNHYVTENLLNVLARYVDIGGQASVRQMILHYGETDNYYKMPCMNLAKKLMDDGKCPEPRVGEDSRRWPVLFLGRHTKDGEEGNYIWKLRDELKEALNEINILQYLTLKEGEEQLSTKETLEKIKRYIAAKGFTFDEGLVENYYLSLKSKPFVILAGTSGTGKTRLVRLFAEAIGANNQNGRYKLVSVRPDWSDSSDLFGHVNLNDKFIPGAIIDFVKKAELDDRNPYFLCLDEMNLARVEYYLSDILSIIETREYKDDRIVTDPLINENYYGADSAARGKYGVVRIPENLYIIGTVNMDETTFPFSRKVLDRANTIEFSTVELLANFEASHDVAKEIYADNTFMKADYVFFNQCASEKDFVEEVCIELQDINKILEKANAHVGYRVRDEIVFYMLNNKKSADLLTRNQAFDHEIMQKILPRIQGSSASVKSMLCKLFKHCAGDYESYQTESDDVSSKIMAAAKKENCKYKESAKKIAFMVRRFEEDGFTAYWL
jgi:MoxR-like ATPase